MKARLKTWGFTRVDFIADNTVDTQGFIAQNDKMILVVFRGSETFRGDMIAPIAAFKDWVLSDANIRQVGGGTKYGTRSRMHRGFTWAASNSIMSKVKALIGKNNTKPVFVTGHSLGGAVATLVAYQLHNSGYPVRALYAHATPRVGDLNFRVKWLSNGPPAYRTAYHRDPVPQYPLSVPAPFAPSPYMDIHSELRFIPKTGSILKNPSGRLLRRQRGTAPFIPGDEKYHASFGYTQRLYMGMSSASRRKMAPILSPVRVGTFPAPARATQQCVWLDASR